MTDLCMRCGVRETVPGRCAQRCRKCLDDVIADADDTPRDDAIVIEHETADGRKQRTVYEPRIDGYEMTLYVDAADGGWRAVGAEKIDRVSVDSPI